LIAVQLNVELGVKHTTVAGRGRGEHDPISRLSMSYDEKRMEQLRAARAASSLQAGCLG